MQLSRVTFNWEQVIGKHVFKQIKLTCLNGWYHSFTFKVNHENECMFTRLFTQRVLNWFNQVNAHQISPTMEETLFGITAISHDTTMI